MFMLVIVLVGCSGSVKSGKHDVSKMIENGKVELAGSSFDIHYDSVISYKYEGDNVVERSHDTQKNLHYYDDKNLLTKLEIYSHDRLILTHYYTYDSNGKETRQESVVEQSNDKTYKETTYSENYKETSYYDTSDTLNLVTESDLNDKQQIMNFISKSKEGVLQSEGHFEYKNDKKVYSQLTRGGKTISESFYNYNDNGDELSAITINYSGKILIQGMYYDNAYDNSKLVQQTVYMFATTEINENEAKNIGKRLK